jgi:hypothetical protein
MPRASADYYKALPERLGDSLSAEQLQRVEELGLLADKDDQGVLLQVHTTYMMIDMRPGVLGSSRRCILTCAFLCVPAGVHAARGGPSDALLGDHPAGGL